MTTTPAPDPDSVVVPHCGRGFAGRALALLVEHLGSVPGVTSAVLRVAPGNKPSVRVAAKAGFTDGGWTTTPDGEALRVFRRSVF